MSANKWVELLQLQEHPEGGYYREMYRSKNSISETDLPEGFRGDHCLGSAIYYLLKDNQFLTFHRVRQDEIWHFYSGNPMLIYTLHAEGAVVRKLGIHPEKGELPMMVIPGGTVFAAEVENRRGYALIGCTVSPGFEFSDYEKLHRDELLEQFPHSRVVIENLSYA